MTPPLFFPSLTKMQEETQQNKRTAKNNKNKLNLNKKKTEPKIIPEIYKPIGNLKPTSIAK
jgi:hypothetical protein